MRYIVELEEGKDIIDLCYAIKDVGIDDLLSDLKRIYIRDNGGIDENN